MSDGFAALERHIARIRSLPGLAKAAAPEVAHVVRVELERQIAAGKDPEGTAWQERQDGERPLKTAANSLAVTFVGSRVFARIRGHVARHHLGRARGGIVRQILPDKGIPRAMGEAISRTLARAFQEHMGGGRG